MSVKKIYYSENGSNYLQVDYYNQNKLYIIITDEEDTQFSVSLTKEDIRHLIIELENKLDEVEVANG